VATQGLGSQEATSVLLRGLRSGASGAWGRLYDQLAPGIHRFACSRLSGDAEAAQDAVVETLADAARRISRFDPQKSSLSAWVYGIARRVVQTELRRRTRHKSVPAWAEVSFEDLAELSDSRDLGARTAARLDAQRRVREAADLVSEPELEMLSLSSINDFSVRDIGRVVGRSEQAVRVALHRARQKARRSAIEGTLYIGGIGPGSVAGHGFRPYSHWFSGTDDSRRGDNIGMSARLSPANDQIVYYVRGPGVQHWPPMSGYIWKAKSDGSEAVNLSEEARLRGINMYPEWSSDGTMIAFVHWGEPGGEAVAPGEAWVMKADGSEARRAAPKSSLPTVRVRWSRDGSCLGCQVDESFPNTHPLSVDLWRGRVQVAAASPFRGFYAEQSPDGSRTASIRRVRGEMEGERGWWNQLVVTNVDGSAPTVPVEQFIADAGVDPHLSRQDGLEAAPAVNWREDLLSLVGPVELAWSPTGDKIAFLAALPFEPEGAHFKLQVDAWIYDLVTRRLTKVTDEPYYQHSLSWR
jgi:RNA polymerase sigma factor (sigma-70 family)